jgi:hypothetical protein
LCRTVENQGIAIVSEATCNCGIRSHPLGDAILFCNQLNYR